MIVMNQCQKKEPRTRHRNLDTAADMKDVTLVTDSILVMRNVLAQVVHENEKSDHAPGTALDFAETEADVVWH